jgi:hypothetical protein
MEGQPLQQRLPRRARHRGVRRRSHIVVGMSATFVHLATPVRSTYDRPRCRGSLWEVCPCVTMRVEGLVRGSSWSPSFRSLPSSHIRPGAAATRAARPPTLAPAARRPVRRAAPPEAHPAARRAAPARPRPAAPRHRPRRVAKPAMRDPARAPPLLSASRRISTSPSSSSTASAAMARNPMMPVPGAASSLESSTCPAWTPAMRTS